MVGGIIVGMTSVGSGSLMIVLLLFLYPMLGANQLVGTDLTQAVPLTLAAALGALAFGHVEVSVTTSLIIGSVPAVVVGSFVSSRAPDRYIRPAITFVIFASGLKYAGLSTTALGGLSAHATNWERRCRTLGQHAHRLAVEEGADVVHHAGEKGAVVLLGDVAEMRREHDIVELAQRMIDRQRLDVEDVEAGAGDAFLPQARR